MLKQEAKARWRFNLIPSRFSPTTAALNLSHLKPGATVEIIHDGESLRRQAITGESFSSTVRGSSECAYAKLYDANNDKPDLYLITSAAQLK